MKIVYQQGADIERESMRIIDEELCRRGVCLPLEQEAVIKRVIHAFLLIVIECFCLYQIL